MAAIFGPKWRAFTVAMTKQSAFPYRMIRDGWRYQLTIFLVRTFGFLKILSAGVLTMPKKRVNVDYKEYLGPDWKPTFTGAGISVSNH